MTSQSITGAPLGLLGGRVDRADAPNPLVNSYRTRDGRWLRLCYLQPDRWWADLCRHIDRLDLIDDPRFCNIGVRNQNNRECIAQLDRVFLSKDLAEWRETLETTLGVWDPALSPEEIAVDPQVMANGYFPEVEDNGGGSFRVVASPVQFGQEPIGVLKPMPESGQHTEEILQEIGYDWEQIGILKDLSAIS